ncbi:MAG: acetate/propionate family kinase [Methylacidiphilales bacterium]|nr:acetate/propionate family kinase [Candidatus Methylacidiphilales bacterium]
MNLLVLNAGSGSHKCSLFRVGTVLPTEPLEPVWKAAIMATDPGSAGQELSLTIASVGQKKEHRALQADLSSRKRVEYLLKLLLEDKSLGLGDAERIDAVGHRVVHGGTEFEKAVVVDAHVESAIQRLAVFAPLHNPVNLEGIQVAREILGAKVPQIAVFDTSFHRTLSESASTYPGPFEWLEKGIRRYGFHGTSFRWASGHAARLLKRENDPALRLIICHLGGGCSLAVTIGGKSVDTTMGFTPMDGIAMCTRSGALDPGILLFLMRENPDVDKLEKTLDRESGLQGLSGLPGDTRILLPEAGKGNHRAKLAMDVFIHRLQSGIGQMMASLNGRPDAIVFTDAIGEDEPLVRSRACEPFKFIGVEVDPEKNATSPLDSDISLPNAPVRVLVVKSREGWQIVRECHEVCQSKSK